MHVREPLVSLLWECNHSPWSTAAGNGRQQWSGDCVIQLSITAVLRGVHQHTHTLAYGTRTRSLYRQTGGVLMATFLLRLLSSLVLLHNRTVLTDKLVQCAENCTLAVAHRALFLATMLIYKHNRQIKWQFITIKGFI